MGMLRKQKQQQEEWAEEIAGKSDPKSGKKHLGFEVGKRSIDDLLQWGSDKRFKLANQRLKKFEGSSYSFQPEIDTKSQKLASEKSRTPVENRLLIAGQKKEEKIKELYQKLQGELFKPDINLNSKQIIKNRKQEDLIARDIGKTKTVNYFEALPRCALEKSNDALYSDRKTPRKGIQTNSRYTSPKKNISSVINEREKSKSASKYVTQQELTDLTIQRCYQESQKKNTQIIPNYVSPYNRDMLESGIPLKTIIDETKASKIKDKQSKLKNAKSRKSARSRSKSKSDIKIQDEPLEFTNKNFLQAMRQAFQQEVEHSDLYKKLPLKPISSSKIKKLRSKTDTNQTPSKYAATTKQEKLSPCRSKSRDITPSNRSLEKIKASILMKESSPLKVNTSSWNKSVKIFGISPKKTEKSSPDKLKIKSRSPAKKPLSEFEKDQLYKKKLKTIGNTYMYQALEKTKKSASPQKKSVEKNSAIKKSQKKNN